MNLIQSMFDKARSKESLRIVITKFEPVVTSLGTFEVKRSPYFIFFYIFVAMGKFYIFLKREWW